MSHAAVLHVDEPCCILTRPLDLSMLCSHRKRLLETMELCTIHWWLVVSPLFEPQKLFLSELTVVHPDVAVSPR